MDLKTGKRKKPAKEIKRKIAANKERKARKAEKAGKADKDRKRVGKARHEKAHRLAFCRRRGASCGGAGAFGVFSDPFMGGGSGKAA